VPASKVTQGTFIAQALLTGRAAPRHHGAMIKLDDVLRNRGSRYAASGAFVPGRAGAQAHVAGLRQEKRYRKATHISWAMISSTEGPLKDDDGEAGAGAVILRMLEREGLHDYVITVTRWFGGVQLGGDRFAHVVTCVRAVLDARAKDA
jgi:putative IMPACT (imprinted ancient) family translation regulator